MKILTKKFYDRPTVSVAKELLGKYLVYKTDKGRIAGTIVETEAYAGKEDKASHASRGLTPRTALMYGEAGHWYIYLVYGFYFCLNVVTEAKDYPAAVLIRALEPTEGEELMRENKKAIKSKNVPLEKLANGPGKLCQSFGLTKELNGAKSFAGNSRLFIEDRGAKISKSEIVAAKRIGVDYAGKWKDKKWRFYLKNNPSVSKK